jgi:hypothetical protein
MDKLKLSTADVVILGAAVLMLIGSLLHFYTFKIDGALIGGGSVHASWNAWSSHFFLIRTIPALLGIAMGVQVALVAFASGVRMPERVLGLTWNQIHVVFALQATIMMLAFLFQDSGELHKGLGLFVMLLAAFVLLGGAVLRLRGHPPRPANPLN